MRTVSLNNGFWTSTGELLKAADMHDFIRANQRALSGHAGYKSSFMKAAAFAFLLDAFQSLDVDWAQK